MSSQPPSYAPIDASPMLPPAPEPGSFWRRVFLMPFLPPLWSAAARWRAIQVVLPLLALVVVADGALAVYRGYGARAALRTAAQKYDASFPAVVLDEQGVHVEGGGVIRFEEKKQTFLVDPEETIPLDDIKTPEYIVVRKHEIIQKRAFQTRVTKIDDLQRVLGTDPIRIDGNSLRAFEARWGLLIHLGLAALMIVVMLVAESVMGAIAGTAAAGIAYGLRGRAAGLTYGQCLKVALACYSVAIVVDLILNLIGHSPGACLGLLIWPTLVTGLTAWRVGR
jgi:hypothetical protein